MLNDMFALELSFILLKLKTGISYLKNVIFFYHEEDLPNLIIPYCEVVKTI